MVNQVMREEIAHVAIERIDGKKTLELKVCPEIEETIKEAAKGLIEPFRNEKFKGSYYPVMQTTPQFKKWAAKYTLNRLDLPLDHAQTYNFSFLFMEGVSKGVALDFGGLYTEEFLVDYVQSFEHFIQEVYNEFVSPLSIVGDLKIRTVRV